MLEHNGHNKKFQSSIQCLIIILDKKRFIITKQKAKKTVYNTKQRDPIMAPSFEGIPVIGLVNASYVCYWQKILTILDRIVALYLALLGSLNYGFDLINAIIFQLYFVSVKYSNMYTNRF